MDSKNSLTERSPRRLLKYLVFGFLVASFVGFLDAAYLSAKFFTGGTIPCTILDGCDVVTRSKYATISGAPIALLGALYYLALFILFALYQDSKRELFLKIAGALTVIGFLFSLRLVYLQAFVLDAYCLYCLFSALTSVVLFALGMSVFFIFRREDSDTSGVLDTDVSGGYGK